MQSPADPDSLDVLVTNYNTSALTSRCIEAIRRFDHPRLRRCIVVDDASTEPLALPEWDKLEVLRNETNQGLVKSLNRGMARSTAPAVVIFDSDAYPLQSFVQEALDTLRNDPRLGLAAFHTRGSGDTRTACSEPEPGLTSLLLGQALNRKWRRRSPFTSKHLVLFTCALLVRSEAFRQVGGFDERFDWLELDNDLSISVRKTGWTLLQTENLLAFHEGGGTPQASSRRLLRFYRNRWLLLCKHGKVPCPRCALWLVRARLRAETAYLSRFGSKRFPDPEVLRDKLEGRRNIAAFMKKEALPIARQVRDGE